MEKDGKRKRRRFSAEYKAETVRLVQRSGKSMGQTLQGLGLSAADAKAAERQADKDVKAAQKQ